MVEGPRVYEGAALINHRGVICGWCWLRFDLLAIGFGVVFGFEMQVRGAAIVPPHMLIVGYTVNHGMADIWCV